MNRLGGISGKIREYNKINSTIFHYQARSKTQPKPTSRERISFPSILRSKITIPKIDKGNRHSRPEQPRSERWPTSPQSMHPPRSKLRLIFSGWVLRRADIGGTGSGERKAESGAETEIRRTLCFEVWNYPWCRTQTCDSVWYHVAIFSLWFG